MADTSRKPEAEESQGRELSDEELAALDAAAWAASEEAGRELSDDELAALNSEAWAASAPQVSGP